MKSKLLFLDIDGTLTSPGSNIPPESALEAIRKAQANGHKVFLCSGRNPAMLSPLLKYNFEGAVASAGGYIFSGDQILFDCPMEKEDFDKAMLLFKENGVFRTIEAKDGSWCDPGMGEFLAGQTGGNSELLRWRKALEADLGIRPISEYDGRPIYKIVFMCESQAQLDPVREAIGDKFNVVIQETFSKQCLNGELINRKYDKGRGILRICDALGMSVEDTIGFGDSMNDLEMIQTVHTSVCMENGAEALKEISDMVCPSVEEDGLAAGFARLGLV